MKIEEVKIDKRSEDEVIDLILDAVSRNKQVLVFVSSKRSAEKVAEDCAKELVNQFDYPNLKNKVLEVLPKPTKQCKRLAKIIKRGCAFHHSGLVPKQRNIIEDAYKNDKVKVICATPTLAQGVNLPAFRVIIRDIKRYSGEGMKFLPVFEYHQ
ncbi:MAG: helicase-related protein, partial [Candidatus Woesearchaeota archaeon]